MSSRPPQDAAGPIRADVDLTVQRRGTGRPVVVLHGGGGPFSVAALVDHLAEHFDVLAPTLPGWNGTLRPDRLTSIDDMALCVLDLLRDLDLRDVAVVGSSVGGWVASAMAVFDGEAGRVARLALVDAVGVEVPGQPITDFFALDARGVAESSFHDSDRFYVDPAGLSDEQKATQAANMTSLRVLAGDPYMHDPHLIHRLGRVRVPVLGLWGDSDGIVTPEYGAAFTAAFPAGRFRIVADAGHLPHIEQPDRTFGFLDPFLRGETRPD